MQPAFSSEMTQDADRHRPRFEGVYLVDVLSYDPFTPEQQRGQLVGVSHLAPKLGSCCETSYG